jgi:energy-coupling factor transporter ATP-binding protein EcfA2
MNDNFENNKQVNLFDIFDITSKNNNRFLITGPSGTGKTHLLYQLIIFVLPKYKRHIYIYSGKDKLKETFIPILKDNYVDVIDLNINSSEELKKINFEALSKNDLLIVDDISHILAERDNELIKFLNQCYTTSRQKGFDCITILHKLKMGINLMKQNCTKLFITGINNEILDEFKEIINTNMLPIIIDLEDGCKQKFLDLSQFHHIIHPSVLIQRIRINNDRGFPAFIRRNKQPLFINIKSNDEKFQYKVPDSYYKTIENLRTYNNAGFKIDDKIPIIQDIKEEAEDQRKIVNKAEFNSGNKNINYPKKFTFKRYSKK